PVVRQLPPTHPAARRRRQLGRSPTTSTPDQDPALRATPHSNLKSPINAPKSLSVAAALHPEVSSALDQAQQDALGEIRRWLGQHSVIRVGPRDAREVLPI